MDQLINNTQNNDLLILSTKNGHIREAWLGLLKPHQLNSPLDIILILLIAAIRHYI